MHPLEGLGVGDSREITWPVIQEDIDHGEQADCWECPIARSLGRIFPEYVGEADHSNLSVADRYTGIPLYVATTPMNACEFMWAFDDNDESPCDFTEDEIEAIVRPFSITATFTRFA